jgi:hypothetical protein
MKLISMNKHRINKSIEHDRLDAALDAALAESFPASDPVAISCPVAVAPAYSRADVLPWKRLIRGSFLKFKARKKSP